jgi:uncharacterized pyridoxal phosphate-containing UPF0001 family protein
VSLIDEIRSRREQIEAELAQLAPGGEPPRIVCVTKTHPIEMVRAAVAAGLREFGENYANELAAKARETSELPIRWHFIGHLQQRQVRLVSGAASVVESLSRVVEADRLAALGFDGEVFVQLAPPGAPPGRNGVSEDEAAKLVDYARSRGLHVTGVMGVAVPGDEAAVRAFFRSLVRFAEAQGLAERSFGMSSDWRLAATEGATIVRLGTALLGPRPSERGSLSPSEGAEVQ